MLTGTKSPWIVVETLLVAAGASLVLAANILCACVLVAGAPRSTPLAAVAGIAAALYVPLALLLVQAQLGSRLTEGDRQQLRIWAVRYPPVHAALCTLLAARSRTRLADYLAIQRLAVKAYWDEEATLFRERARAWHTVPSRHPHQIDRRPAHQRHPSRLPKRSPTEASHSRYRASRIACQ